MITLLERLVKFQVKIQGQNAEMLLSACEQFLGKSEQEIQHIALVTLEGHQRAIMGSMTVEEIYKDRKIFSKKVCYLHILMTLWPDSRCV